MATSVKSLLAIVLPKGKSNPAGTSVTTTFNETSPDQVLSVPGYRDHQTDIFADRNNSDSRALIKTMLRQDPDMSASLNAFLTVSNTDLIRLVKNPDGTLDAAGQQILDQLMVSLFVRNDYSTGFKMPLSLSSLTEAMRYMVLMRGGVAGELLISKEFFPVGVRQIDLGVVEWLEPAPGDYKPQQRTSTGRVVSLDMPSFFVSWFRRDPTGIYSYSPFVSAINTIAARQQVINDLYRIMQVTGYPRMHATVLEEVVLKNAPPSVQSGPLKNRQEYIAGVLGNLRNTLSSLQPNQIFVSTDSVEVGTMNDKMPGMAIDITPVISAMNAQNQAGLKTMATILGRGESGVNTASVEARIFSLSAQALNEPIAEWLSNALTLALRLNGSLSYVDCWFKPVEMRSDTELATQQLVKAQQLRQDLSDGLITDVEYHLKVYDRLPPPGTPVLSGTRFSTPAQGVDTTAISPNGDPVGKSATAPGGNGGARDNKSKVKK